MKLHPWCIILDLFTTKIQYGASRLTAITLLLTLKCEFVFLILGLKYLDSPLKYFKRLSTEIDNSQTLDTECMYVCMYVFIENAIMKITEYFFALNF